MTKDTSDLVDILPQITFKCSVSSVLNREVKQNGKEFLFDGREDTAWSSEASSPQHILIAPDAPLTVSALTIQFQGGFVGADARMQLEDATGQSLYADAFYPEDHNGRQLFALPQPVQLVRKIRLRFGSSSDFFGRIIVYKLEVHS